MYDDERSLRSEPGHHLCTRSEVELAENALRVHFTCQASLSVGVESGAGAVADRSGVRAPSLARRSVLLTDQNTATVKLWGGPNFSSSVGIGPLAPYPGLIRV